MCRSVTGCAIAQAVTHEYRQWTLPASDLEREVRAASAE